MPSTIHLANLRQNLMIVGESDLREFCFDHDIDYEGLPVPGNFSKQDKAISLITFLHRHGRINELAEWGTRKFPNLIWNEVTTNSSFECEQTSKSISITGISLSLLLALALLILVIASSSNIWNSIQTLIGAQQKPNDLQGETLSHPTSSPIIPYTPKPALVIELAPGTLMTFVNVPKGEFTMGSNQSLDIDAQPNEQPQHQVYVSEFYIAKYEVTNAHFAVFVRDSGYQTVAEIDNGGSLWDGKKWQYNTNANWQQPTGKYRLSVNDAQKPVVLISLDDAVKFCQWLSQRTGKFIRLPTEAEWEKAARGIDKPIFPWGNEYGSSKLNASPSSVIGPIAVGTFSPWGDSWYGASDMSGNVAEWTNDRYDVTIYKSQANLDSLIRDPQGPSSGALRVVRGGSWHSDRTQVRAAARTSSGPNFRGNDTGFRVVVSLSP